MARTRRGITSKEGFGRPSFSYPGQILPASIQDAAALGVPNAKKLLEILTLSGIPTAQALGTPSANPGGRSISPSSIASAQAFGPSSQLSIWTPAELRCTLWLRASYTGSPWTGLASIGPSLGRNATNAVPATTPTVGTAVAGRTPARNPPATDTRFLTSSSVTDLVIGGSVAATRYSGFIVFQLESTAFGPDASDWRISPALLADANGQFGLHCFHDGSSFKFRVITADSKAPNASLGLEVLTGFELLMFRWNDSLQRLQLKRASQAWQTASDNKGAITTTLSVANTTLFKSGLGSPAQHFCGSILETAISDVIWSDNDFEKIRRYVNAIYGFNF